jgi:hypothetical protein
MPTQKEALILESRLISKHSDLGCYALSGSGFLLLFFLIVLLDQIVTPRTD